MSSAHAACVCFDSYNSLMAVFFMTPLAFYAEYADAIKSSALQNSAFWFAMVSASLLGFLISIATFMQINYTSALTNNISGTVKVRRACVPVGRSNSICRIVFCSARRPQFRRCSRFSCLATKSR